MSHIYHKFIQDLQLPKGVTETLFLARNNEELTVFALSLPDLLYPDTYVLAGRLFIYLNTLSAPKKIKSYVDTLQDILREDICKFLLDHEQILDQLLSDTYFDNFKNENMMSASKTVDYLQKLSSDDPAVETPCQMMLRQAVEFYHDEGIDRVIRCYRELIDQEYIHASPVMFNAGTKKNQLASCFLVTIGDSLSDILGTGVTDCGKISQKLGGLGIAMNLIRHSAISNSGKSKGIPPFARTLDSNIRCVDQGGKRNGAETLSLNDWHFDIPEYVQLRDNYTNNGVRLKQANTAIFVSSLFMERVIEGKKWTLFCPAKAVLDGEKLSDKNGQEFEQLYHRLEDEITKRQKIFDQIDQEIKCLEKKINSEKCTDQDIDRLNKMVKERIKARKNIIDHRVIDARKLYTQICDMEIKSSFPYYVYTDTVNGKNNTSNIGKTQSSNLCLEITLPSTPDTISSCNLAHVNLKKYVKTKVLENGETEKYYDFNHLGRATQSAVENVEKAIKFGYYVLDERDEKGNVTKKGKIHIPNIENRPIGIGVSGLAEVFALLELPYESEEAHILNKKIFAAMYFNAIYRSVELSKRLGEYKTFRTGKSKVYDKSVNKYIELNGSLMSNGYFQFDLWRCEADYLESIGRLDHKIYRREDDIPIQPEEWGNNLEVKDWDQLRQMVMKDGMRHSMLIALMPTASSAQKLRNSETTEAPQTLMHSRKLAHGNYTAFSEPFVQDMIREGLWNQKMIDFINICNGTISQIHLFVSDNPEYFSEEFFSSGKIKQEKLDAIFKLQKIHKGMYDISQKVTTRMARQRGIYVCQSQSLNIYLPEPSKELVSAVHLYTYKLGLKTGMYYLRANPLAKTGKFTTSLAVKKYFKGMVKGKVICTDQQCIMCES